MGKSAATKVLKLGAPALPLGPAKKVFAVVVATPVPPLAIAMAVPLQVPVAIVPSVVILLVPTHVLNSVFSTLPKPTFDLLIPVATFASVTARSASLMLVIPPSATPPPALFAATYSFTAF